MPDTQEGLNKYIIINNYDNNDFLRYAVHTACQALCWCWGQMESRHRSFLMVKNLIREEEQVSYGKQRVTALMVNRHQTHVRTG